LEDTNASKIGLVGVKTNMDEAWAAWHKRAANKRLRGTRKKRLISTSGNNKMHERKFPVRSVSVSFADPERFSSPAICSTDWAITDKVQSQYRSWSKADVARSQ